MTDVNIATMNSALLANLRSLSSFDMGAPVSPLPIGPLFDYSGGSNLGTSLDQFYNINPVLPSFDSGISFPSLLPNLGQMFNFTPSLPNLGQMFANLNQNITIPATNTSSASGAANPMISYPKVNTNPTLSVAPTVATNTKMNSNVDLSFWQNLGYNVNRGNALGSDAYRAYQAHGGKWEPSKCSLRTKECINRVFNIDNKHYVNGCDWGSKNLAVNPLLKDKFKKVPMEWVREHGCPEGSILVWPSSYFSKGAAASAGHVAVAHNGSSVSNCIMSLRGVSEVWIPIA